MRWFEAVLLCVWRRVSSLCYAVPIAERSAVRESDTVMRSRGSKRREGWKIGDGRMVMG